MLRPAVTVVLFLVTFGSPASIAAPPLDVYAALPAAQLATLSPSGKYLALRQTTRKSDLVVVYDLDAGDMLTAVDVSSINPRAQKFVGDDFLVLVSGGTVRRFPRVDPFDYSVAIEIDIETGKVARLLKRTEGLFPYQASTGRIVGATPDERDLLMPAYEWGNDRAPHFSLYRVRLGSIRERRVHEGGPDTIDWFVDANGNALVREDYDNQDDQHRIWIIEGSKRRLLYEEETDIRNVYPVGLTPDRSALIVTAVAENGSSSFFRLRFSDGELEGPILERTDKSVGRVLVDTNRVVLGVEFAGFKPEYEFFDSELTKRVKEIQASLPDTALRLESWNEDLSVLIMHASGGWNAGASLLFRKGEPEPQFIASDFPDLPNESVAPTQITRYKARDGLEIPALITAYESVLAQGTAPLIVLPHGGPASYDRFGFDWLVQYFASRNYVVLQPQFRGSRGFGWDFFAAGHGEWGGKMQTDLDDGVRFMADQGLIDPERVCIVGASYGGYAALAASAFSSELYRCAASINGVSDLYEMLDDSSRDHGRDHWVISYFERFYGAGRKDKDRIDALSPARNVENINIPILLIHGRDDTVVPIDQSRRMHKALREADKQVEFVQLDGEDHWLTYPDTRLAALRTIAEFVERHLPTNQP